LNIGADMVEIQNNEYYHKKLSGLKKRDSLANIVNQINLGNANYIKHKKQRQQVRHPFSHSSLSLISEN